MEESEIEKGGKKKEYRTVIKVDNGARQHSVAAITQP